MYTLGDSSVQLAQSLQQDVTIYYLCETGSEDAIITKLEAVPEKKESVLSRPVAFRVKEKELALLCSQFAIILASGLSVERCVSMVAAQTKNKYLRRMLDKVSEEVGAGYSLAQSFENNAPYLPKTFTETLRAGQLEGTAEQFAEVEKQYRITMAAIQALD